MQAEKATEKEQQQRVRAEKIASFLGATYRSADPARDGRSVKVVEILARAEKEIALQFADDDLTRWSLWLQLARAWTSLAQYQDAQRLLDSIYPEIGLRQDGRSAAAFPAYVCRRSEPRGNALF